MVILGIVLLLVWIFAFLVFKVTGAIIHLLLLLAVVSFIMRFVRGRTSASKVS